MFTSVTAFGQTTILPFVMEVKSDNAGSSPSNQFTLTGAELRTGTTFDVNFSPIADPTNITEVILNVSSPTITFPSTGSFIVRVDDKKFNRIRFNNGGDRQKVLTITQWGDIQWSSMDKAFWGCGNMDVTATDYPDLSKVKSMGYMFSNCNNLVATSDFNDWDVSNVTDMELMFNVTNLFNQDISGWDVSNVTNIEQMFASSLFNQDIGGWDVGNVTTMRNTFEFSSFNNSGSSSIGAWNVSNVTSLRGTFANTGFNQDISGWDVSNVTIMDLMFNNSAFNQNIGGWNIGGLSSTFSAMFQNSGMSCANYTDTIVGWANYVNTNGVPKSKNLTFNAGRVFANDRSGGAAFADSGAARAYLTGSLPDGGWTISGDTVAASC